MVRASSEAKTRVWRNELVLPWTLVFGLCVLVAATTADRTETSFALGVPLLGLGALLMLVSFAALGGTGGRFVAGGPYRWVRHPLYLGMLVAAAGVIVIGRSLSAAVLFVPTVLVTVARARREEENLIRGRLGSGYDEYRRRVPFLVPFRISRVATRIWGRPR